MSGLDGSQGRTVLYGDHSRTWLAVMVPLLVCCMEFIVLLLLVLYVCVCCYLCLVLSLLIVFFAIFSLISVSWI